MTDDIINEGQKLREELVSLGYFGSRIHVSRASVFSHPDTGKHEFFLRIKEARADTISRFAVEREQAMERMAPAPTF